MERSKRIKRIVLFLVIIIFFVWMINFLFKGFSFVCGKKVVRNWIFYASIREVERGDERKIGSCYRLFSLKPLYRCKGMSYEKEIEFKAFITRKGLIWVEDVRNIVKKDNLTEDEIYTICNGEVIGGKWCVIYRCGR